MSSTEYRRRIAVAAGSARARRAKPRDLPPATAAELEAGWQAIRAWNGRPGSGAPPAADVCARCSLPFTDVDGLAFALSATVPAAWACRWLCSACAEHVAAAT